MVSFKVLATSHQLGFFRGENQVGLEKKGRAQDHWLNKESAEAGHIFYDGYDIFKYVREEFRKNKKDTPEWFCDTLRSQHIPFNFFVPLMKERRLCINVLNHLFDLDIAHIIAIKFEYPQHAYNPLKDKTSFDVFISYVTPDYKKVFIGFEVKYTEGGYSPTERESKNPVYYYLTPSSLYKNPEEPDLKKNSYRQIWRNHLLAYKLKNSVYDEFLSVTLYPGGNRHFSKAIGAYDNFLTEVGQNTLAGLTYEDFIEVLSIFCKTEEQRNWVKYLNERYLIGKTAKAREGFSQRNAKV